MARPAPLVRLSAKQRAILESLARSRTAAQRVVERATIVVAADDGATGTEIAERLGVDGHEGVQAEGAKRIVAADALRRDAQHLDELFADVILDERASVRAGRRAHGAPGRERDRGAAISRRPLGRSI